MESYKTSEQILSEYNLLYVAVRASIKKLLPKEEHKTKRYLQLSEGQVKSIDSDGKVNYLLSSCRTPFLRRDFDHLSLNDSILVLQYLERHLD